MVDMFRAAGDQENLGKLRVRADWIIMKTMHFKIIPSLPYNATSQINVSIRLYRFLNLN